mgnify:CR=1 FL=1
MCADKSGEIGEGDWRNHESSTSKSSSDSESDPNPDPDLESKSRSSGTRDGTDDSEEEG